MTEPDNLTLVILREMRADMERLQSQITVEFAAVNKRLDAMHANGVKGLSSFIGHRSMVERTVASFDDQVKQLESRVEALEAARA